MPPSSQETMPFNQRCDQKWIMPNRGGTVTRDSPLLLLSFHSYAQIIWQDDEKGAPARRGVGRRGTTNASGFPVRTNKQPLRVLFKMYSIVSYDENYLDRLAFKVLYWSSQLHSFILVQAKRAGRTKRQVSGETASLIPPPARIGDGASPGAPPGALPEAEKIQI